MSDLELLPLNHPMLKVPPNEFVDWENAEEFGDKIWKRQQSLGGIGLSANQVGLNARVFTMGAGAKKWIFFNPELVSHSDTVVMMEEGCLSAPGLMLRVKRPEKCTLSYQNENQEIVMEEFDGLWARVVLHEYDHMLGQNMLQRVGKLQLDRALKKVKKQNKKIKMLKSSAA